MTETEHVPTVVDVDDFYIFLKETKKELDKMGSVIFPMKGNEVFDDAKAALKARLALVKSLIRQIEES